MILWGRPKFSGPSTYAKKCFLARPYMRPCKIKFQVSNIRAKTFLAEYLLRSIHVFRNRSIVRISRLVRIFFKCVTMLKTLIKKCSQKNPKTFEIFMKKKIISDVAKCWLLFLWLFVSCQKIHDNFCLKKMCKNGEKNKFYSSDGGGSANAGEYQKYMERCPYKDYKDQVKKSRIRPYIPLFMGPVRSFATFLAPKYKFQLVMTPFLPRSGLRYKIWPIIFVVGQALYHFKA